MASQTQLILIGFLLASPLFLGPGPVEGIVILENKSLVWGKRKKPYRKGKQIPFLGLSQEQEWPGL